MALLKGEIMNVRQLIIMWVGIAVFVYFAFTTQAVFVMTPYYQDVRYGPLIARLATTAAVTIGLLFTFADKKDEKSKDDQKQ